MSYITGLGQSTPAMRQNYANATRRTGGGKRKKKRAAKPARKAKRAKKSSGRKLKFGSPAWRKKYMKKGKKKK